MITGRRHKLLPAMIACACLLLTGTGTGYGQSASGSLKRQGDVLFEAGQYRSALRVYRMGGLEQSEDKKVRYRIGVCLYEINDPDGAIRIFQSLIQEGKTPAEVFLHAAKSYQAKSLYTEAIVHYKRFLQRAKSKEPLIPGVKEELIRCANGVRMKFAAEQAYIENAGTAINTQFNEFGARPSPTNMDKIYFNSDRDDVARGKRPNGNVDIYSASLINGRWNTPMPLPSHINSAGYEEVLGFTSDGQVLYYLAPSGSRFAIYTDTFTGDPEIVHKGIFKGPPGLAGAGADLFFFNDTICLFSAQLPGGYGGYDLYISLLKNTEWTVPYNLGPVINSAYDDRFPFLTRDGQTLFYSSNNLQSTGGFDVFVSTFDPATLQWQPPQNPGFPFNSPLNDTYFVLSHDGVSGYVTSDRKEGYGQEDLYRIIFKQPVLAHQQISRLPVFYDWILLYGSDGGSIVRTPAGRPQEIKEYYFSHLYFDEQSDILTPQNIKKLDLLANMMMIYPHIHAELACFQLPSGQRTINLYFSIKRAEKAAEYLTRKGILRNRIIVKGFGSSFPYVARSSGGAVSPLYPKVNQRVEIRLHYYESEPVILHIEQPQVTESLRDPKGIRFSELRDELYYSVQIASVTQILQNQELEPVEDMFIEVDNANGQYLYMVGMAPAYNEAESILSAMMNIGFYEARIVPYLHGKRLSKEEAPQHIEVYPDLKIYLEAK